MRTRRSFFWMLALGICVIAVVTTLFPLTASAQIIKCPGDPGCPTANPGSGGQPHKPHPTKTPTDVPTATPTPAGGGSPLEPYPYPYPSPYPYPYPYPNPHPYPTGFPFPTLIVHPTLVIPPTVPFPQFCGFGCIFLPPWILVELGVLVIVVASILLFWRLFGPGGRGGGGGGGIGQ